MNTEAKDDKRILQGQIFKLGKKIQKLEQEKSCLLKISQYLVDVSVSLENRLRAVEEYVRGE